jgi:hypothetical protein
MPYFDSVAFLAHCRIGFGKRPGHLSGPFAGMPVLVGNDAVDAAFSDFFCPRKIFGSLGFCDLFCLSPLMISP